MYIKLLEKFYDSYQDYYEKMLSRYEEHKNTELIDLAHKLKGASKSLGIDPLAAAAAEIEDSLLQSKSDRQQIKFELEQLGKVYTLTMEELKVFLKRSV